MDYILFQKINGLAGQWSFLDSLGVFFASYLEYILIASLFWIFWRKWKIIAQAFSAAVLSRFVVTEIIRWIFPRLRPFVENKVNLLLSHEAGASFPSGHAAFYFAIAAVVYSYNKKAGMGFLAASFLISISRVFAGIHWPSDILAGAVIGIFSGWLIVIAIAQLVAKRMMK